MQLKKERTKYSAIYDTLSLGLFAFFFFITLAGYLWIIIGKVERTDLSILRARVGYLAFSTMPYLFLPCVIFFLRTRVIGQNGVSAKFFGIRYKYIRWENLESYRIKSYAPWHLRDKKKRDNYRDAMFFKSYPNKKGKSTVIIVYATDEARLLAEKYFGPPLSSE